MRPTSEVCSPDGARKLCDEHVRIVGEVVQKQSLRI